MKEWKVARETEEVAGLALELGIPKIVSQLFVNRNIKDSSSCQDFLYPKRKSLYSPFFLPDLDKAVLRIREAIDKKEKILLFGDYDVDGVTSLAMLSDYLSKRKVDFEVMIPSRFHQGYGFNKLALESAKNKGVDLIIALDCGTNSSLLDEALSLGKDVIVIDHHQVLSKKRGYLLVNPKRSDCDYPFRDLSSGALVFKLIWALKNIFPYEYLDLVALSIVCDVAPLVGENRILVKEGLRKMRSSPCLGVESLMRVSSLRKEYVDTFHLGWILGPRLNASGRINAAYPAFQLLSTEVQEEAEELSFLLDKDNRDRQTESQNLLNFALAKVEREVDLAKDFVIVLAQENWHIGILGIVASRIKEKFSRPAFLISLKNNLGRGSGRSIDKFHLIYALDKCRNFLRDYGGHSRACGIEIEKGKIDQFREAINSVAKEVLDEKDLIPEVFIDKEIGFQEINQKLIEYLELFSPFGEANPEPIFLSRNLRVKNITDYKGKDKLIWFQQKVSKDKEFVYPAWVGGNNRFFQLLEFGESFDIIYNLRKNEGKFPSPAFLKLQDVRISG